MTSGSARLRGTGLEALTGHPLTGFGHLHPYHAPRPKMLLGAGIDPQTLCLTVLRCTIELHGLLSNIHSRILGTSIGTYSCRSSIQLYL